MASETTLTTANDVTYSAIIAELILKELGNAALPPNLVRQFDISNKPSKAIDVPVWATISAAAVAEATDLTNTALSTDKVTITAGEVGVNYMAPIAA